MGSGRGVVSGSGIVPDGTPAVIPRRFEFSDPRCRGIEGGGGVTGWAGTAGIHMVGWESIQSCDELASHSRSVSPGAGGS
jgi:hypothetical protein